MSPTPASPCVTTFSTVRKMTTPTPSLNRDSPLIKIIDTDVECTSEQQHA